MEASFFNGLKNKLSHLVGPPFPAFKACFLAVHFLRALIKILLIGVLPSSCGQLFPTSGASRS